MCLTKAAKIIFVKMNHLLEMLLSRKNIPLAEIVFITLLLTYIFWSAMEIADLKKENRLLMKQYAALAERMRAREQPPVPQDTAKAAHKTVKKEAKKGALTAAAGVSKQNAVLQDTQTQGPMNIVAGKKTQPNIADLPDLTAPASRLPATLNNGPADRKIVCLTFDGGSLANAASDIFDTLKSRNVRATMFLTGEFIRKFPDVAKRLVSEGHEAGNHLFSHPHLTTFPQDRTQTCLPGVNASLVCRELRAAEQKFQETTGRAFAPLWRAPYGESNSAICRWAQACGYLHVGWRQGGRWSENLDSNDWIPSEETRGYRSPQEVLGKILAAADAQPGGINGGIILMHLGTVRAERDKQVHLILGTLIDKLRERGYTFVTAGEMAAAAGIDLSILPQRIGGNHLSSSTAQ